MHIPPKAKLLIYPEYLKCKIETRKENLLSEANTPFFFIHALGVTFKSKMSIDKEDLDEIKEIYLKEFGVTISDEKAKEIRGLCFSLAEFALKVWLSEKRKNLSDEFISGNKK